MYKAILLVIISTLFALPTWGATWYVCSSAGEYGAEDGTSESNCYDGQGDVVWGAGGVQAGDTLVVVGELASGTNGLVVGLTGTSGSPIRITGLLGSSPGSINCGGTGNYGIRSLQNYEYIHIDNLTVKNCIVSAIQQSPVDYSTGNWTLTDVTIQNNGLFGGSPSAALQFQGSNNSFVRVSVDNVINDALRTYPSTAGVIYLEDFVCTRADRGGAVGDCIQHRGTADLVLLGGYINQDTAQKQAILDTSSGNLRILGTPQHPLVCDGSKTGDECIGLNKPGGTYFIHGVQFRDIKNNAVALDGNVAPGSIESNIFQRVGGTRVYVKSNTTATPHRVSNNTDVGSPGGFLVNNLAVGVTVEVKNNVIDMSSGAKALSKLATNTLISDYNDFYNPPPDAWQSSGAPTTHSTLAEWQAVTSQDAHSTSADPKFIGGANPTTAEGFKPFATSPLCGAGYPTAAKYDYANKRLGNPPNIGAYGTCTAGRSSYSTRSTYVPR